MNSLLPPRVKAQAAELARASAVMKDTQSLMQNLADSFVVRETIRDFMLHIVTLPVREGEPVPEVKDLIKAATDRGLPLIMVPSRKLLADVLTTTSFMEGSEVLFRDQNEIVKRCRVMLQGSMPRDFAPAAVEALLQVQPISLEAVDLFTAGHYVGAQATATAVLDTLLSKVVGEHFDFLGWKEHQGAYNQTSILKLLKIIDNSSPGEPERTLALKLIIPPAMRAFEIDKYPARAEYNRHATIHR